MLACRDVLDRDERVEEYHASGWTYSWFVGVDGETAFKSEKANLGVEMKGLTLLCSVVLTKARKTVNLANSTALPFTALLAMKVKQMLFPLRIRRRALFSMSHSRGTTL